MQFAYITAWRLKNAVLALEWQVDFKAAKCPLSQVAPRTDTCEERLFASLQSRNSPVVCHGCGRLHFCFGGPARLPANRRCSVARSLNQSAPRCRSGIGNVFIAFEYGDNESTDPDVLVDEFLPVYDVSDAVATVVAADVPTTWSARMAVA